MGDSITFGEGLPNKSVTSYPAVLGRLLGRNYQVRNFGVSGTTVINNGALPYQAQSAFTDALLFKPAILIVALGTNDSKAPFNTQKTANFEADYKSLIASFRRINSSVKVYTCLPIPSYTKTRKENGILSQSILPLIQTVASDTNARVIDLNTPFTDRQDLYRDAYHPTVAGASYLASIIYKNL